MVGDTCTADGKRLGHQVRATSPAPATTQLLLPQQQPPNANTSATSHCTFKMRTSRTVFCLIFSSLSLSLIFLIATIWPVSLWRAFSTTPYVLQGTTQQASWTSRNTHERCQQTHVDRQGGVRAVHQPSCLSCGHEWHLTRGHLKESRVLCCVVGRVCMECVWLHGCLIRPSWNAFRQEQTPISPIHPASHWSSATGM